MKTLSRKKSLVRAASLTGMASEPPLIMKLAMPVPLTSILSRTRARKRTNRCASFTLTLLAGIMPTLAYAHPGEAGGLAHGLAHPFTGLDHLCAMAAVGLWAAQMGGRAVWLMPLSFVAIMMLGGLLGMTGIVIPFAETGIVMSLLVLGLLIAAAVRLPLALISVLVGVFALFHGYAHGTEMSPGGSVFAYFSGFVLASVFLSLSGFAFGILVRTYMQRLAGAAVAMAGGYLWFVA